MRRKKFSQSKKSLKQWVGFYKEYLKLGRKLSKEKRSTSSQGNQKGDGISVELFQILKDDAVKMLLSLCQQIWKTQQWPQDWKRSVFIPIPRKSNARECSNYYSIAVISHARKSLLKILQARLQQYVNWELPDVQVGFRKTKELKIKLPHTLDYLKTKRVPEKYLLLLYWLCQSLWLCGWQQTVENSLRIFLKITKNTRPPDLPPEKPVCWSRSNS